jgi:phosphoglycerol transferase MdoB-like AlkP superfamily enzyme
VKKNLVQSVTQMVTIILIFVMIRVLEFLWASHLGTVDFSMNFFLSRSVNLDSLFLFYWGTGVLMVSSLIGFINLRAARAVLKSLGILIVVIHLVFTGYFLITHNVLNSTLFEFSFAEIIEIVGNEFSWKTTMFLLISVAITMVSIWLVNKSIPRLKFSPRSQSVILVVYFLAGVFAVLNRNHTVKPIRYFNSNYEFLIGNSKEMLFLSSVWNQQEVYDFNLYETINQTQRYQKDRGYFHFTNDQMPLVHNEAYNNVLGPYFVKDTTIKPNIVLIVCESLSSSYSGENCVTPNSITPFVDSLAAKGLNWTNFFSNAERSYGAMPNILSSLPNGTGRRGFINMGLPLATGKLYPIHQSLLGLLKQHEYQSSFYYGGWGYYDNLGYYFDFHGINHLVTEDSFDTQLFDRNMESFSWGYNDQDLFQQSQLLKHNKAKVTPFIDVYQTLSVHTPFTSAPSKYYNAEYITNRLNAQKINRKEISYLPDHIMANIFFTDDAIKEFITDVSKDSSYNNTIFIITGDHAIDFPMGEGPLNKFHIPLVIYSNLIKTPESFDGFGSHIDVTPSILALLSENFGMEFPEEKHWIGRGLDVSKSHRNHRFIPLCIYDDLLPQCVIDNYVVYKDRIIEFDLKFNTSELTDQDLITELRSRLDNYIYVNQYACTQDRLWYAN